jgi:transposase
MSLSRSLPASDVLKARLILMLAYGRSYADIRRRLETTSPTISHWKKRFLDDRIPGLTDNRHPGRKPSVITPKLQARVLEATRRKPKDGSTHWSVRKLARELRISKDAVHRIWRKAGVKPHRLERYMASDDPDFESKAAAIIGLYLNPRNMRPSSAWMRSRPFKRLTAWTPYFLYRPAERSGMVLNTIAMARYRSSRSGCEDRKGTRQNGRPPYQRRVRGFSGTGSGSVPAPAGDSHHPR